MTGLREAGSHGHDAVDVDIGILERKESERSVGQGGKASTEHYGGEDLGKEATPNKKYERGWDRPQ